MGANFDLEVQVKASAEFHVFGVDEVGRGPLAGPVVAAAVQIPLPLWDADAVGHLQDSKKVGAKKRAILADWIRTHCRWSLAEVSAQEIDRLNILAASLRAMARALDQVPADFALIDGPKVPPTPVPALAVVRGDGRSRSIAAASILAKDHRDRLMRALDADFPAYGWVQNAGYPTALHRQALKDLGPTPHHRRTFKGVIPTAKV